MILQVVFGTLLFVLFINIEELNAASYNSPTAPANLHAEKNDKTGLRILRDVAPKSGGRKPAEPESDEIDNFSLLPLGNVDKNIVKIANQAMEGENAKKFRSVVISLIEAGVSSVLASLVG